MTEPMVERRITPRQKTFLRGKLYFNNRLNVVDCLVRDISESGVKLVFSEAVTTPDEVELFIPQKEQTFFIKIAWRNGAEVGAEFLQAAQGKLAETDELARRLARLEGEIAGLKRIIKKLKLTEGMESEVA